MKGYKTACSGMTCALSEPCGFPKLGGLAPFRFVDAASAE
jgi:hypothetical protein